MEIAESIKKVIQELILPEFGRMKLENEEIKSLLQLTNKRIDDVNTHLVDQSRRIDGLNNRIDETNKRIDELKDEVNERIDEVNERIDRLYEVIVRREEHQVLEMKIIKTEQDIKWIKEELLRLAA